MPSRSYLVLGIGGVFGLALTYTLVSIVVNWNVPQTRASHARISTSERARRSRERRAAAAA